MTEQPDPTEPDRTPPPPAAEDQERAADGAPSPGATDGPDDAPRPPDAPSWWPTRTPGTPGTPDVTPPRPAAAPGTPPPGATGEAAFVPPDASAGPAPTRPDPANGADRAASPNGGDAVGDPGHYLPTADTMHRLSPLTLVTEPVRYLRNFLVPFVLALFAGTFNPYILIAALLMLTWFVVQGIVTYQTFRYQVGPERLEIRHGLLNRTRRSIPLERIRGVDVTATLLHRALGLVVVKIEAAAGGAGAEEGKLDAVSRAEADRLRGLLLRRREALRGEAPSPAAPEAGAAAPGAAARDEAAAEETVFFTMPPRWYFYGTLSLGHLLTPFAALAALLGLLGQVGGEVWLELLGDAEIRGITDYFNNGGRAALILVTAVAVAVLLLLMPVFAVVTYTVNHWGFTLLRRDRSLVAERGLFTRQSVTLELRRIRGHEITDTPLERLAGAARLRAVVTGLGETATRAVLLPIGARDRVQEVVGQALTPFTGTLVPHPPAARQRRLFRAVVPFLVLGAALLAVDLVWPAFAAFALAVLGVPLGLDRYRSLGHGDDGTQISVRSGSLSRRQAVLGRSAVIGWRWSQTIFQRRAGLVTLEASVGAGSGGYAAIDMDFAGSLRYVEGITPDMVRPFVRR